MPIDAHVDDERPGHPRVVIIGGGFAGLATARALRDAPVEVTLIDRVNHHLFQPLLYQMATGILSPANVAAPLRSVLRGQQNVRVLLGEVEDIDLQRRCIRDAGFEVSYDYLVVATGARHDYFGNDWSSVAPGLKTIADATEIRRRILGAFEAAEVSATDATDGSGEETGAWLTFVVVGGGPTGVELAGTLGEIARQTLRRDFRHIDPARACILLLEGGERILAPYPASLASRARRALQRLGVEVVTSARVTSVTLDGVTVSRAEGDEFVPARTVLWAAGVRASRLGPLLGQRAGVIPDRAGRIPVGPSLTLPGYDEVYVIGDLAAATDVGGVHPPGLAAVAIQEGEFAGRAIAARVRGESVPLLRYRDQGAMAVVGRGYAIARLGRLRLWGRPGWLMWAGLHLARIVEFENRVLVLVQWVWNYLTHANAARLIVGPAPRSERLRRAGGRTAEQATGSGNDRASRLS